MLVFYSHVGNTFIPGGGLDLLFFIEVVMYMLANSKIFGILCIVLWEIVCSVPFLGAIVLSVLRPTASDCPSDIFKLFVHIDQ